MILEYIQKIKDWPVPKTGKEIAMFLGFAGITKPSYLNTQRELTG